MYQNKSCSETEKLKKIYIKITPKQRTACTQRPHVMIFQQQQVKYTLQYYIFFSLLLVHFISVCFLYCVLKYCISYRVSYWLEDSCTCIKISSINKKLYILIISMHIILFSQIFKRIQLCFSFLSSLEERCFSDSPSSVNSCQFVNILGSHFYPVFMKFVQYVSCDGQISLELGHMCAITRSTVKVKENACNHSKCGIFIQSMKLAQNV